MTDWGPALLLGLIERWPTLALAAAPFLAMALCTSAFVLATMAVRGRRPDELTLTTEAWVRDALKRQGLDDVRVGPTPAGAASVDAYWPTAHYIALKPATLDRRDPTFWAIGAHEVGHAIHARHPVWGRVFLAGRAAGIGSERLVTAALIASWLVGGPIGYTSVFVTLSAAILANTVVLADEAWASATALRLLREGPTLHRSQVFRAIIALVSAFSAYLASYAARIGILAMWPSLWSRIHGGTLPPTPTLSWLVLLALAGLSVPLTTRAVRITYRIVRPKRFHRLSELGPHQVLENASDLTGGFAAMAFVAASVLLPPSPARDLTLILALVPALVPITGILTSLALLPVSAFLHEAERLDRKRGLLTRGVVPDDYRGPPRASGSPALTLEMHNDPSWGLRGLELLRIGYVPLLIVFWASAMGST